jgi:hypothetical protein
MGGAMSADRTVVGRLWLELVVKHYLACRDADAPRQAKLFDLLDNLTDEFPDDVRAEIDSYLPAAEKMLQRRSFGGHLQPQPSRPRPSTVFPKPAGRVFDPMTLRELRLLQAAEAVVSSWEVYRDDISDNVLRLRGRHNLRA